MAAFGYSVGDFFMVVQLAFNTYQRCQNATTAFNDIGRDVGNTHIVLRTIHRFWEDEEKRGRPLLVLQQDTLKQYAKECNEVLLQLEKIGEEHGDLAEGGTRAKIKYAFKDFMRDFGSLRTRLQRCTGNLAIFHTMLTQEALARSSDDQREILEELKVQAQILQVLVIGYKEFQDGTRVEPAYSQSVRARGPQMEQSYQAAEDDLRAEGIEISAAKKHHALIKEWVDTVVNATTNDEDDHMSAIDERSTLVEDVKAPVHAMNSLSVAENDELPMRGDNAATGEARPPTNAEKFTSNPRKERKEPKPRRSESIETHRSQASSWDHPDADREDFANIMLAKVLKHKYPPQDDRTVYLLPIKRVFHHVDWTSRGWLSRVQVEDICLSAGLRAGKVFERSEIALIVKAENDKRGVADHHITAEEFTNIVMTLQERVLAVTIQRSGAEAILICARLLRNWCNTALDRSMLSTRWSLQIRYPTVESELAQPAYQPAYYRETVPVEHPKPPPQPYAVYHHEIAGDLPQGSCPLLGIMTTTVYLATAHCTSRVDTALRQWRPHLLKSAPAKRAEYIEALNKALQAASAFHALEDRYTPGIFHLVDEILEIASILPAEMLTGDLEGCPVQDALQLQSQCWTLLFPILSFVNDLGGIAVSMIPPNTQQWRQKRMSARAELIEKGASSWPELSVAMEKICGWYIKNGPALRSRLVESIEEAEILSKEQGELLEYRAARYVAISATVDKIPHPPFKPLATSCKVSIDDAEYAWTSAVKQSSLTWNMRSISVKRDSKILLAVVEGRRFAEIRTLGQVELLAKDVVDFDRGAVVTVQKPIQIRSSSSSKTCQMTITIGPALTPAYYERSAKEKEQGNIATRIQPNPVPDSWTRHKAGIGVYFKNRKTSKCTPILWTDPMVSIPPPPAAQRPLPPPWRRFVANSQVFYVDPEYPGSTAILEGPADDSSITSMRFVKARTFAEPGVFYL